MEDPSQKNVKRLKKYCDMLHFMADSDEGIPTVCPCGGEIVVVDSPETETDPGNKYFICNQFPDDEMERGLHRKKNWFNGVQEEIGMLKKNVKSQSSKIRSLELQMEEVCKEMKALNEKLVSLDV